MQEAGLGKIEATRIRRFSAVGRVSVLAFRSAPSRGKLAGMPNYVRAHLPGGTYFSTVALL